MEPEQKELYLEPELQLSHAEKSYLASLATMHGYKVFHKIIKSECDKLIVRFLNVDNADKDKVLSAHLGAQIAAQLYTQWNDTVNSIIEEFTHSPIPGEVIGDATEQTLDMGGFIETVPIREQLRGVPVVQEDILEER